jgi:hypothetical protein
MPPPTGISSVVASAVAPPPPPPFLPLGVPLPVGVVVPSVGYVSSSPLPHPASTAATPRAPSPWKTILRDVRTSPVMATPFVTRMNLQPA